MKLTSVMHLSKNKAYKRGIRRILQKKRFGKVVREGNRI